MMPIRVQEAPTSPRVVTQWTQTFTSSRLLGQRTPLRRPSTVSRPAVATAVLLGLYLPPRCSLSFRLRQEGQEGRRTMHFSPPPCRSITSKSPNRRYLHCA